MSDCTAYMLDSIPIKWIYDAELGTVESGGVTLLSGVPEWYAETIPLMIYMNRGAGIGHRATRIFYRAILREVAAMHPGTKGPANERLCNLGLREL
jgi:hypothetical protein